MSSPLLADLPDNAVPISFADSTTGALTVLVAVWATSEEDGCDSDAGPTERARLGDECRCRRRIVMAAMQHPREERFTWQPSVDFLSGRFNMHVGTFTVKFSLNRQIRNFRRYPEPLAQLHEDRPMGIH